MTDECISPLRQRMIEDMSVRTRRSTPTPSAGFSRSFVTNSSCSD